MKIILGSKSKWRQNILRDMGYGFEVITADIDEKQIRSRDFKELTLLLARAKAEAILPKIKQDAILITSDVVVVCNGKALEKPESERQAKKFLKSYLKHPAETVTAILAVNTKTEKRAEGVDVAKAYFREIPNSEIEKYIRKGNAMKCAGAFAIHDPEIRKYIYKVKGTEDSIAGFPRKLVERLIKKVEG